MRMSYEKLKKTKFFENYEKALKGDLILQSESSINLNKESLGKKQRIFTCGSCGKVILEYDEGKYIVDESIMANLNKEKRVRCTCGRVNIFK